MKPSVLITRAMPPATLARAQALFDVAQPAEDRPLTLEEARAALDGFHGILPTLGDDFSAAAFEGKRGAHCRVLANFGVGYNHIDAAAARAAGIVVTNTPGAVTDATADIARMLILMSARRAGEGERLVRAGRWRGWRPTQLLGLHVTGRTVGIVGMGRIGQAIARRCHLGFGMEVVYFNRSEKALDFPARRAGTLAELAGAADVVVVAVPGGAETHHMIGAEVFAAMRRHAHFVNIARGDVVDEAALIAALQSGGIAGAGLDVYEHEPEVPQALREMENVTLLPHLGTAAREVRERMGAMALDDLEAVLSGRPPLNPVN